MTIATIIPKESANIDKQGNQYGDQQETKDETILRRFPLQNMWV